MCWGWIMLWNLNEVFPIFILFLCRFDDILSESLLRTRDLHCHCHRREDDNIEKFKLNGKSESACICRKVQATCHWKPTTVHRQQRKPFPIDVNEWPNSPNPQPQFNWKLSKQHRGVWVCVVSASSSMKIYSILSACCAAIVVLGRAVERERGRQRE